MLEEDAEIGILALEKGWVSRHSIDECLTALAQNPGKDLAALFREQAVLSDAQIAELREEAIRRVRDRGIPEPGETPLSQGGIPTRVIEASKNPAQRLDKFVLVAELGRGGVGTVWQAWDSDLKQWVALRVVDDAGGKEGIARLLIDAQRSAGLDHPGIVTLYEARRHGEDRISISMELVEGRTLAELRGEGVGVRRSAEIVRDAARAVHYAHEQGVIHRDLKPTNVMVDLEGRVRVMDCGLARHAATLGPSDDQMLSRTIQVMGTPEYMSPEQALGRTHDIRERSDVYSLGAIFFFLLAGRPPIQGKNDIQTCFAVVKETPPAPSSLNPEIPAGLDRVILRALDKDPVRRYESAAAMAEDLERFLQGVPVLSDDQMRYTRGVAALQAGRLEEAIHMFRDLIRFEGSARGAVIGLDAVLSELERAEQGLTLAIAQQGKNYDIRTQRGVYRFARAIIRSIEGKDPSATCREAMEDFVAAAGLRPEFTAARINRANALIFGGRYARDSGKDVSSVFEMAKDDLSAAIRFDGTCSLAYHNRGIVYFYIGGELKRKSDDPEFPFRKAIEDFSRAAELEPTYAYVFKDLGVVKVALAKHLLGKGVKVKNLFLEAVAHLETACRLNPGIAAAFYELGHAHFALKDFPQAVKDFRRCIELDPGRERRVKELIGEAERYQASRVHGPLRPGPSSPG